MYFGGHKGLGEGGGSGGLWGGANQVRATQKWGWTLFRLGRVCFTNYHFYSTNPVNNLTIVNKGVGRGGEGALDMSHFLLQTRVTKRMR